jgi:hypothetical protein
MILQSAWQKSFGFLGSKPIVVEPVDEDMTSDAGLLSIRQFDEQIGLTRARVSLPPAATTPLMNNCL